MEAVDTQPAGSSRKGQQGVLWSQPGEGASIHRGRLGGGQVARSRTSPVPQ